MLHAIPILNDNYIWVLRQGSDVLAVDPGDAAPLIAWLQQNGLVLAAILLTHHHHDHTDGVAGLIHPGLPVYGPARIGTVNHPLAGGETITVLGRSWQVIATPGHTLDHLCYYGNQTLFCGDTLFSGGCGRLFEGTAEQMQHSLATLAALPEDTRVCCTHEYTLSNLRFASQVDAGNPALASRIAECTALRERGLPTLPSTIATERATNPFLRLDTTNLRRVVSQLAPQAQSISSRFAALRQLKDQQ